MENILHPLFLLPMLTLLAGLAYAIWQRFKTKGQSRGGTP